MGAEARLVQHQVVDTGLQVGTVRALMIIIGMIQIDAGRTIAYILEGRPDWRNDVTSGFRQRDGSRCKQVGVVLEVAESLVVVVGGCPGRLQDYLAGRGCCPDLVRKRTDGREDGGIPGGILCIASLFVALSLNKCIIERTAGDGILGERQVAEGGEGLRPLEIGHHIYLVPFCKGDFLQHPNRVVVIGEGIAETEDALGVGWCLRAEILHVRSGKTERSEAAVSATGGGRKRAAVAGFAAFHTAADLKLPGDGLRQLERVHHRRMLVIISGRDSGTNVADTALPAVSVQDFHHPVLCRRGITDHSCVKVDV